QGVVIIQLAGHVGNDVHQARLIDAEDVTVGSGRVNERADDGVEDGFDPQGLLGRQYLMHHRMEKRCVHKADADVANELFDAAGAKVDLNAQRLQHVGAARKAGDRAASVLGNGNAGSSRHDGNGRRNVKGAQAATGSARVD